MDRLAVNDLQPPEPPKTFYLNRVKDASGVSGQGVVAVGVQLPSGRCVVEWITDAVGEYSIGIYSSLDGVKKVHGHSGNTDIVFYTNEVPDGEASGS
jgi:hypothetical protein